MRNVFDLTASITLDSKEYDRGIEKAKKQSNGLMQTLGKLSGAVGKGLATAAKIGVAGIGAATAAIGALTKKSIEGYADFEQLVGGVETLFGAQGMSLEDYAKSVGQTVEQAKSSFDSLQKAQDTVLKNAAQSFKTAGLSQNQYMETITSFSASLIQSVGGDTEKAANYADMAIQDMADNANKMGSDIGSIQSAYQGFAKQNYSMLDNLKLGYGGSAQEMYRLLKDAASMNKEFKKTADFSIDSKGHLTAGYDEIVQAIHIVQDNMGVTGTTAKEASTTISGSLNSAKAAWSDMITGMSNENADFGTLVDNFVTTVIGETDETGKRVGGVFNNILPRIKTALQGATQLVSELLPVVMEEIPSIVTEYLPQFVDSGAEVLTSLLKGLSDNTDKIGETIRTVIKTVSDFLINNLPDIIQLGFDLLIDLAEGLVSMLPQLAPQLIDLVMKIGKILVDNAGELVSAAVDLVLALVEGLTSEESITKLVDGVVDIINSIVKLITEDKIIVKLVKAAISIVTSLLKAIPTIITKLAEALPEIVTGLVEALTDPETLMMLATAGIQLIGALFQSLPEIISAAVGSLGSVIQAMIDGVGAFLGNFMEIGGQIIGWIGDGISNAWNSITSWFSGAVEGIKSAFRALPEWFGNIFSSAWNGIKDAFSKVGEFFTKIWEGIKAPFKTVADWFSGVFQKAWEGVKSVFETGGKIFTGIKDGIVNAFKTIVNGIIDGINKVVAVPFNGINTALDALRGLDIWGWKPFEWLSTIEVPQIPKLARGGVLGRGQVGLLEGNGAEAVVPLEKNKQWIHAVAEDMKQELQPVSITINNPVVREDEDIERIAEAVSNALGIDFNQRGVAYG